MDQTWCNDMKRLIAELPRGAVVATCTLVDCVRIHEIEPSSEQERAFGDYSEGRFAWLLSDVVPLPFPIPVKGALGIWEWAPPEGVR
jgi:hypothetical protein